MAIVLTHGNCDWLHVLEKRVKRGKLKVLFFSQLKTTEVSQSASCHSDCVYMDAFSFVTALLSMRLRLLFTWH